MIGAIGMASPDSGALHHWPGRHVLRKRPGYWSALMTVLGLVAMLALGAFLPGTQQTAQAQALSQYATEVVSFTPGEYLYTGPCIDPLTPNNQNGTASGALGAPGGSTASLGNGGEIVLRFDQAFSGSGDDAGDIFIHEPGLGEAYTVYVSADGANWTEIGTNPPELPGERSFDIDAAGFDQSDRLYYVRIVDLASGTLACLPQHGMSVTGADIDGVEILSAAPTPSLTIEKTNNVTDPESLEIGDVIEFEFLVTNTGNVNLTDVTITDELDGLTWVTGPDVGDLLAGGTATGVAQYTLTAADFNNGEVVNSATVTGDPSDDCADCDVPVSPPGTTTVEVPQEPGLTVSKSADPAADVAVGDIIEYSFLVENTGNVTLTGVTIADPLTGLEWVTGPGVGDLDPGETATGTATYEVTQDDVDAGGVLNSATATGTPPPGAGDPPVSPPSDVEVPITRTPALSILKEANTAGPVAIGETIEYTFTVENTGNVSLIDVTITDELDGLVWVTGPIVGDLAPGETATGTATYVTDEDDILAGGVSNSATVTGTPPDGSGEPPVSPPSDVTVPGVDPETGLSIAKVASTAGPVVAGDVITYTFDVVNTGTVSLTDVTISDQLPGLEWVTGPIVGDLAPGEVATGEANYTVTADDVASGGVANSATVTGTPPDGTGDPPVSPPSEITVPGADPGLSIVKESDTAGPVSAGDVITYTFTVTNTGNVPLADVTITDTLAGIEWVTGPNVGSLEAGASTTGSATYVVTETDVFNGGVVNSATATGTPPDGAGDPPVSPPSEITVPGGDVPAPGALVVDKSADAMGEVHPGDLITFTFVVTNTGGTAVENVTVSDPLPGLGPVEGPHGTKLGAGESATFTSTYPVTESDAIAGEIINTATATGTGVDGSTVTGEDTVNLAACDPVASDTPTETPGPGTPEADDDADAESQFGAAATCTGIVEPNPDPDDSNDPPSEPRPTNPPSNGGGNNGGGNNGGGNSGGGGGGGPVTQLPSTGQSGQADASVLGSPLLVALLIALVALFGVALRLQVRRDRG